MSANLVNLNVNPCKMCMPMGAVTAFYGIQGCMSILHGSQGCATYIRRHMATHYNEPVDIASSALTEQGTVFGGEKNLLKGIDNLIALYHPEVIGIATTCLAETIGEDVDAMIAKYYETHPDSKVKIISVASAGYGGTQYEGFMRVLHAIVSQTEMDTSPNDYINIVTSMISPADIRWLKSLLDDMGLSYILLPDLSENLDSGNMAVYERLPQGGTPLSLVRKMGGARMTIELSAFVQDSASPAQYLSDTYGVPFVRLSLPVGIENTDALIDELKKLGGAESRALKNERARLVDGMIDAHKYSGEARVAVFGEPDFVDAVSALCCENGAIPLLCTTGSVCPELKPRMEERLKQSAAVQLEKEPIVLDDCDFETIEKYCVEQGINLMIGSSDGRRVAHKLGIDLIRCAFPIHDRVGGQRFRMLGYEGSQNLLEHIANSTLARKEETFRTELFDRYYSPEQDVKSTQEEHTMTKTTKTMEERTKTHPCFNCGAARSARIHLPVAPKCNIQCNYCVRKFDCPNESRPGVTTEVLSAEQAAEKYFAVKEKIPNLTVVGIAGPGDALANFEQTRQTLRLIREKDDDVTFCLSTNGLMLPLYAQELIDLGVSHVTVTINAVEPEIGAKIYRHIDYMGHRYTGTAGAAVLLANQLSGLKYLTDRGVVCKVNIVVLKGINDTHIEEVVKTVKGLGVYITNIMQMIPVPGSAFENMEQTSMKEINQIRKACSAHVQQMFHCKQCRADAIGTLDNDQSIEFRGCGGCGETEKPEEKKAVRFAVASKSGMLVDLHFGQADEFYIYESDGDQARLVEKRSVPRYCGGAEECDEDESKMDRILKTVSDCGGVLALRIGYAPSQKLKEQGIRVFSTYDRIESAVNTSAKAIIS